MRQRKDPTGWLSRRRTHLVQGTTYGFIGILARCPRGPFGRIVPRSVAGQGRCTGGGSLAGARSVNSSPRSDVPTSAFRVTEVWSCYCARGHNQPASEEKLLTIEEGFYKLPSRYLSTP